MKRRSFFALVAAALGARKLPASRIFRTPLGRRITGAQIIAQQKASGIAIARYCREREATLYSQAYDRALSHFRELQALNFAGHEVTIIDPDGTRRKIKINAGGAS